MKKKFGVIVILVLTAIALTAQNMPVKVEDRDSLLKALSQSKEDSNRVRILGDLAWTFHANKDTAIAYYNKAILLAHQLGRYNQEASLKNLLGNIYWNVANYPAALENYMQALRYYEKVNDTEHEKIIYSNFGNIYYTLGNYRKALQYTYQGLLNNRSRRGFEYCTIAKAYLGLNMPDSALFYCGEAKDISKETNDDFNLARSMQTFGDIYLAKQDLEKSLSSYQQGIIYAGKIEWQLGLAELSESIAKVFYRQGATDSAVHYANSALQIARNAQALGVVVDASVLLHEIFKNTDRQLSLVYLEQAYAAKDSLFNNQKINALQNFAQSEEARQKDKEAVELQYRNNLVFYGLAAGLAAIALIAFIQLQSNKQRKKANLLLTGQKQQLEKTLSELKLTQAQLIHSEKMASLGELTAGIAHEIQNPLNFVNNFSEVSNELLDELKQELEKGDYDEVKLIMEDVKQNLAKINHHGMRADGIVKGMLQHSRTSSGQKEQTDINTLCAEYLRLAYHGLRAKDKTFNAELKTDFDDSIGKLSVVPQEIGRVLLNLINNAFYAVTERQKTAGPDFKPLVVVSTKSISYLQGNTNGVEISVADNGNGIPANIREKIFQPFFTTKPTGQGTGLGLSLSYDIIKAHGGTLAILETNSGVGTNFIIKLPA